MKGYLWNIFEIFTSVLEAFIYIRFMQKIFGQRTSFLKQIMAYATYAATITICDYFNVHIVIKLLVMLCISCIISKVSFRISNSNIIAYSIIWNVFAMACDTLVISILLQVYDSIDINLLYDQTGLRLQAVLFSRLVFYILLEFFIKLSITSKYKYRYRELCYMIIQTITCMIYLIFSMELAIYYSEHIRPITLTFFSLVTIVSYIISYEIFNNYFESKEKEKEIYKMEAYINKQYEHYQALEDNQASIRKMYHDINNHLMTVSELYTVDKEEAKEYIKNIKQVITPMQSYFDTGSSIADIIFNEKYQYARDLNVDMEVRIEKGCLNHIKNIQLCAILSNALDNAIEACKQQNSNRVIQVKALVNSQGTILTFENPYTKLNISKNSYFHTTKEDKLHHGIGLLSIKEAVKYCMGEMHIELENDKFLLIVLIPHIPLMDHVGEG